MSQKHRHGSDVGTVVGMVGGAVVGAAIGQATEEKQKAQRQEDIEYSRRQHYGNDNYDSGFDATNSGDDRIYDFRGSDYTGDYSSQQPLVTMPMQSGVESLAGNLRYTPNIEVRNARFIDGNQNGKIERGEMSKIIFEVYNRSKHTLYDVVPTVVEATGNKHIVISPNMHVEQILPGKGIRYTALVKADNRLKDGLTKFCVSVVQGGQSISKVSEFNIPTRK